MLLKQHNGNAGDSLDLSSLTLEESSPPVEEVLTNISCAKVNLKCTFAESFLSIMYPRGWDYSVGVFKHSFSFYSNLFTKRCLFSLPACAAVLLSI